MNKKTRTIIWIVLGVVLVVLFGILLSGFIGQAEKVSFDQFLELLKGTADIDGDGTVEIHVYDGGEYTGSFEADKKAAGEAAPLLGGFEIPAHSFGLIPFYAITFFIADGEIELCFCVSLFGGLLIPVHSFGLILFYTVTIGIPKGEIELGVGIASFGGDKKMWLRRFSF